MQVGALFNENKLKLGVFAFNLSHGCAITTVEERNPVRWSTHAEIAGLVDAAGIEAIVPAARWKGMGGPSDFNGSGFESLTWAAGVGARTSRSAVFATVHAPAIHPLVAAKQCTTIDHITDGRFALNLVAGWFKPEFDMLGHEMLDHSARYEYSREWLTLLRRLWSEEEEFDFEGRFFRSRGARLAPRPIQRPFPPVMNAGSSPIGRRFAAELADMAFVNVSLWDLDKARAEIADLKQLARTEFGRELQVWTYSYVVCRETEKEANEYLRYYADSHGDQEAVENLISVLGIQSESFPPDILAMLKREFIAGYAGYPLVGTKEQITDRLATLTDLGIDGTVLTFVDYAAELPRFVSDVLPLLSQAGLRSVP